MVKELHRLLEVGEVEQVLASGYGESLSSLSEDLRMVINYSISSDQTQYHNLRKK